MLLALAQHARSAVNGKQGLGNSSVDVVDQIDPLIGSKSGGNVFAGATLPYGMAKGMNHRWTTMEGTLTGCQPWLM